MYLTDFRENTLQDVITRARFIFNGNWSYGQRLPFVQLRVFNTEQMNQLFLLLDVMRMLHYAVGIESHEGLSHYGLFNTVVAIEE